MAENTFSKAESIYALIPKPPVAEQKSPLYHSMVTSAAHGSLVPAHPGASFPETHAAWHPRSTPASSTPGTSRWG